MVFWMAFLLLCLTSIDGSSGDSQRNIVPRTAVDNYRRARVQKGLGIKQTFSLSPETKRRWQVLEDFEIEDIEEVIRHSRCNYVDGWNKADPNNCRRYLSCNHGKYFLESCFKGTSFYEPVNHCVDGRIPSCDKPKRTKTTTTTNIPHFSLVTTTTTEKYVTEEETDIEQDDPYYYCVYQMYWIRLDVEDCSRYYMCVNGWKSHIQCPYGLEYSEEEKNCLSPEKAKCRLRIWRRVSAK